MTKQQVRYLISATALILVTASISVTQTTTRWILLPETEAEPGTNLSLTSVTEVARGALCITSRLVNSPTLK
ncbi:MAG TPA: hypothetical protein VGD61_04390 [Pyrinomonadaceae bacterium]